MRRRILQTFGLISCLCMTTIVGADEEHCISVGSAGVRTTTPGPSFHNVGQMALGISTSPTVRALQGNLYCLRIDTLCSPGDLNADGDVNGLDIQPFTDVKVSGAGTPLELCASDMTVAQFIALLLAP